MSRSDVLEKSRRLDVASSRIEVSFKSSEYTFLLPLDAVDEEGEVSSFLHDLMQKTPEAHMLCEEMECMRARASSLLGGLSEDQLRSVVDILTASKREGAKRAAKRTKQRQVKKK